MYRITNEKVQAAFQLLNVHDPAERENDCFAKFTPGLSWKPFDDPLWKDVKVLFVDFASPGVWLIHQLPEKVFYICIMKMLILYDYLFNY